MRRVISLAAILAAGFTLRASGALSSTVTDTTTGASVTVNGSLGANEYGPGNTFSFAGGGTGFGGTLGNGRLYVESDSTNLYLALQAGANLNDLVVLYLDTRPGGFTDAQMNDNADGGRRVSSNLTRDVEDVFPAGVLPDYSVVFASFGIVIFELNAGTSDGHLTFRQFDGAFTGADPTVIREVAIPLATLANPTAINLFAAYTSDTNFTSNESLPAQPFNASGNPGFDNGGSPLIHADHNQFLVPEPGMISLAAVGALSLLRRRRA